MSTDFDGPDLMVGEIRAVRTFDLRSDGSLWPVFAAHRPWTNGVNEARCARHQPAAAAGCKCGYWAYGSLPALRDQLASRNVAAVVSCWGRATPGTRGLRAQFARIDALWLSQRVRPALRELVQQKYPDVAIYTDRAAMLAAHPLTVLPSYEQPLRPRVQLRIAGFIAALLFALVVVLGVLPREALDVQWVAALRDTVVRTLSCFAVFGAVMWVFDRLVYRRGRSSAGQLLLIVAVLAAWLHAPYTSLPWAVLLRLPLVLGLLPAMLFRMLRFVPTRADPDAEPPPDPPSQTWAPGDPPPRPGASGPQPG